MRRLLLLCGFFCSLFILLACQQKKKPSLAGDEPVDVADFIEFFPEKKVPFSIGDTTLLRKEKDSLLISYKVFTQFVPDSLLVPVFGKTKKVRIFPLGRFKASDEEQYLVIKAISGDKTAAWLLVFGKKDQFIDGIRFLRPDADPATWQTAGVDRSFSVNYTVNRKNRDGSVSEGKDVFAFNKDSGHFMLIMTDPLDDRITELVNPIDTLPRKNKWSADYGSGKLNLVSVRDGRKSDRISFFVHFERNNGECSGELKGEAIMKSANTAEYHEGGDPCVLRFSFSGGSVTLKEGEGCGAHRGLRCSFDGSFSRKKDPKPTRKTGGRKR